MKKRWLGLLAGLLLFTWQPMWGQAATDGGANTQGTTKTQISFYGSNAKPTTEQISDAIITGTGPRRTVTQKAKASTITGTLQQALATGRLPQTGESVYVISKF